MFTEMDFRSSAEVGIFSELVYTAEFRGGGHGDGHGNGHGRGRGQGNVDEDIQYKHEQ